MKTKPQFLILLVMTNLDKQFDNLRVMGYALGSMQNVTIEQLLEDKRLFQEQYEVELAALDTLIARKRREEKANSNSKNQTETSVRPLRTVKEATTMAVDGTKAKFTLEDIFSEVQRTFTKYRPTKAAVSTALSIMKKEKKIKEVTPRNGATPGEYKKA